MHNVTRGNSQEGKRDQKDQTAQKVGKRDLGVCSKEETGGVSGELKEEGKVVDKSNKR